MKIENQYERTCRGLSELVARRKKQETVFPNLRFAGIKSDFDFWLGKRILAVILIGFVGFLLPWTIGKFFNLIVFETSGFFAPVIYSIALGIAFSVSLTIIFYLHLFYQIEGRARMVEDILPDFLMLVASNVNAGMTPASAFRNAARKEFGPLSEEIKAAAAKSLGTQSFTQALLAVSKNIKSKVLLETVAFFSQSLRSGGHLATLLETSANDLRQTQEMRRELISSTKMYTIFVGFIIVVATPVLLGVSVQFLKMITTIQTQNPTGSDITGAVSFLATELRITPEFMQTTAYFLLLINAFLSSLFIGMLGTGKAKLGLKNFPLLLIASIIVFFIATTFLEQLLSF